MSRLEVVLDKKLGRANCGFLFDSEGGRYASSAN